MNRLPTPTRRRPGAAVPLLAALAIGALAAFGAGPAAAQMTPAEIDSAYEEALRRVRGGDAAGGLALLERVHRAAPGNLRIGRDRAAVLAWVGRDAEAVEAFAALRDPDPPIFVREAIARAYCNLGR